MASGGNAHLLDDRGLTVPTASGCRSDRTVSAWFESSSVAAFAPRRAVAHLELRVAGEIAARDRRMDRVEHPVGQQGGLRMVLTPHAHYLLWTAWP